MSILLSLEIRVWCDGDRWYAHAPGLKEPVHAPVGDWKGLYERVRAELRRGKPSA